MVKTIRVKFKCDECGGEINMDKLDIILGEDDHTYVRVTGLCLICKGIVDSEKYFSIEDIILMSHSIHPDDDYEYGFEKPEVEA